MGQAWGGGGGGTALLRDRHPPRTCRSRCTWGPRRPPASSRAAPPPPPRRYRRRLCAATATAHPPCRRQSAAAAGRAIARFVSGWPPIARVALPPLDGREDRQTKNRARAWRRANRARLLSRLLERECGVAPAVLRRPFCRGGGALVGVGVREEREGHVRERGAGAFGVAAPLLHVGIVTAGGHRRRRAAERHRVLHEPQLLTAAADRYTTVTRRFGSKTRPGGAAAWPRRKHTTVTLRCEPTRSCDVPRS